ncbi:BLOC-3 complex member HPS1 isoform X1 [Bombina bombina]|uniref:BLOC-3 complex member HPS1 isoform X1 n=2 Tax=Bombina bombina TaxID=8345 RepID=UPI00235AEC92|nr:BLOC-3 complex member HPS1 isoform X1 [Bombina bombina]XP_053548535.1 BLOC-3 complex member HPS1 isoform X1 [Bombina bombina]XP_053548536.1 BLOC-3 complex member HPS1 isoform X1 [Bombina bombina]
MKCLLIVSEGAEILFCWSDEEFEQNLHSRYDLSDQSQPPIFGDSINTLFAPLIISCVTLLEQINDTYTCFTSDNGHLCVLHMFGECLYIAVNGDGSENEDDLRRKLYVLKRLTEVHFGLVTFDSQLIKRELRPPDSDQRNIVWKTFQSLLMTYSRLRIEDQSFAVEAVERLIHPKLCEQCIEFLEKQIVYHINSSTERGGEEVLHAFILVNTKLLALFSSRNASSLRPADLLTLILIVQDLYPEIAAVQDQNLEELEDNAPSEEYYTPDPSPNNSSLGGGSWIDDSPASSFTDAEIQIAEDSLKMLIGSPQEPTNTRRVFLDANLREGYCPMMPHSMYCFPLFPSISLVLLTKFSGSQIALTLYQLLDGFSIIEKKLTEGQEIHQILRSHPILADLKQRTDRFVKNLGGRESPLQVSWLDFKTRAFSRSETSTELIQACGNMKRQLCSVYRQLFLATPISGTHTLSLNLQTYARDLVQKKLDDWKDFLLVKSKRNITIVTYLEEFPGLVHFIYVDRTVGQMVAPSLHTDENIPTELGSGLLAHFIKNKIWSFIGLSRRYLQKGYTTLTVRDGDYYCCYFLWFENEAGDKLDVIEVPVLGDDSAPVGMLAGEYYRKLLRYYSINQQVEIIKCYELLTIHLGVIPPEFVIQQCHNLARKLWEPSRIPIL